MMTRNIEGKDFFKKIRSADSTVFERIFKVRQINLNLKTFKNFPQFQKQEIFIIKDKILGTEAIFNFSRKNRPLPQEKIKIRDEPDPFCEAGSLTPPDELGRLENEAVITAANLAKMADYHSLIIFKKHYFESLNKNDFKNAVILSKNWFEKIKNFDREVLTFILIWNYHHRAGASILHPHFQILAYKETPQKIEIWHNNFESYKQKFGSQYLDDYFQIAEKLGIAKKLSKLKIWMSLTPFKEKTLFLQGDIEEFWQILEKLIKNGTQSFNIFYIYESLFIKNFGFFIDRGEINKSNSDFGSLEIFGLPVVSYNPFELAKLIFR